MRRRALAGGLTAAFAGLLLSCAAIFGIDEMPRRPPPEAGAEARAEDTAPPPSAIDCDAAHRFCACSAHDFCADFDGDGAAVGEGWTGVPELGSEPTAFKGDAGITFAEGTSPPNAVRVTTHSVRQSGYALLGEVLDHTKLRPNEALAGLDLTVEVRPEVVTFSEVRGPLDVGSAIVSGIAHLQGAVLQGVAVLVAEHGLYLFASDDLFNVGGGGGAPLEGVNVQLLDGDVLQFSSTWTRLELLVTSRELATADPYKYLCAGVPAGAPVMAARLGPKEGCATLPDSFGGLSWLGAPVVAIGAASFGGGDVTIRHDNVTVDFLPAR